MVTFFLAFLATALACLCGRDAARVAQLAAAHQRIAMLLLAVGLAAAGAASVAAVFAGSLEPVLQGRAARLFVALALALAGLEVLLLRPGPKPREPTRSLGAIVLVLFTALLTGAPGFLVLALAVFGDSPGLAGAGGAAGMVAALSLAALVGQDWQRVPHKALRAAGGLALLTAAAANGFVIATGSY